MSERRDIWSWTKSEPELRSLYEYIDLRSAGTCTKQSWLILGVSVASFTIAFATSITYLKTHHLKIHDAPGWFFGPLGIASAITALLAFWYFAREKPEQREHRKRVWKAQSYTSKLSMARWSGNVKEKLGEKEALALNAAAYDFLRCRSALQSDVWKGVSKENLWGSARDKAELVIDSAMIQLITIIGQGASSDQPEVIRLVEDLHRTAEEILTTTEKLSVTKGISINVSQDLRQVLGEMRSLGEAHDELMNQDNVL